MDSYTSLSSSRCSSDKLIVDCREGGRLFDLLLVGGVDGELTNLIDSCLRTTTLFSLGDEVANVIDVGVCTAFNTDVVEDSGKLSKDCRLLTMLGFSSFLTAATGRVTSFSDGGGVGSFRKSQLLVKLGKFVIAKLFKEVDSVRYRVDDNVCEDVTRERMYCFMSSPIIPLSRSVSV